MSGWRSGDIVSLGAGLALVASLCTPWVLAASGAPRYALASGQESLFAFGVIAATGLVVSGAMRTSWTGLVALLAAFLTAFIGFTAAIPAHAQGAHPGFGLFALAAGGAMAMVAAVLNAIEREGRAL